MKNYTLRKASQFVGVSVAGFNRLVNRGDLMERDDGALVRVARWLERRLRKR